MSRSGIRWARSPSTGGLPAPVVHSLEPRGHRGAGGTGRLSPMDSPLIVSDDRALLDELERLAAAAGVRPVLAHDEAAALRGWTSAPLVLVGVDAAKAMVQVEPPRRAG